MNKLFIKGINIIGKFNDTTPSDVAKEITSPLWDVIEIARNVILVVLGVFLIISILTMIYGQKQNNGDQIGSAKKNIIACVIGIGVIISALPILSIFGIRP